MNNKDLNKLISKDELNDVELKESFDEIFSGLADNVQSASFLSLVNQFSESVIISALNSSLSAYKKPFSLFPLNDIIQNHRSNDDQNHDCGQCIYVRCDTGLIH